MKKTLLFVLLSILLAPSLRAQAVTTAEEDRQLYLDSLEYQARADICTSKQAGFGDKLKPLLRRWKMRNDARLHVGDAFLRAEAARDLIAVEDILDVIVHKPVAKLQTASADELQKSCDDVLYFYGPDGPYSEDPKPKKKTDAAKPAQPQAQSAAPPSAPGKAKPKPKSKNKPKTKLQPKPQAKKP